MKQHKSTSSGVSVGKIVGILAVAILVFGGIALLEYRESGAAHHAGDSGGFGGNLIGNPAPQFSLNDRNGVTYSNDSLKGKKVILFFNEGIMCYPACWNQMVALATDNRFQASDTAALSVVIDSPGDWQSAIAKMPDLGKATVLFDSSKSVSQAFGMLAAPSSMHYGS